MKLQVMKRKDKKVKDLDTVKTFREIRDKISKDIQGMNFEQLKEYLEKNELKENKSLKESVNAVLRRNN
jgi:hypothetical protein